MKLKKNLANPTLDANQYLVGARLAISSKMQRSVDLYVVFIVLSHRIFSTFLVNKSPLSVASSRKYGYGVLVLHERVFIMFSSVLTTFCMRILIKICGRTLVF